MHFRMCSINFIITLYTKISSYCIIYRICCI
nr:MAG TPA: hypothetical protein [Bacteriophage sp.]